MSNSKDLDISEDAFPKAVPFFKQFMDSHHDDFLMKMREYRTYPQGGYASFYRDNEVMQVMDNIYHNLYDGFKNLKIPEDFASPKKLATSWQRFLSFLKSENSLFNDIYTKLSKKEDEDSNYPAVLVEIDNVRNDVISALEYVTQLSEVKSVLNDTTAEGISNVGDENTPGEGAIDKKDNENEPKIDYPRQAQDTYDIVVLTAIYKEFEAFKKLMLNGKTKRVEDPSRTIYHKGEIEVIKNGKEQRLKVLLTCANQMGMVAAASLTSKLIYKFGPKMVAMCGIAAGISGDIGDIMVPDILWDYGSGKYSAIQSGNTKENKDDRHFHPYRYPKEIKPSLIGELIRSAKEREFLEDIIGSEEYEFNDKAEKLKVHIGPFVSGSAVIANDSILEDIKKQDGKLIGFDMEAYGVVYATQSAFINPQPTVFIAKSISDYGNKKKANKDKSKHQDYAAFTSANYLLKVIQNKFSFLDL